MAHVAELISSAIVKDTAKPWPKDFLCNDDGDFTRIEKWNEYGVRKFRQTAYGRSTQWSWE